MNSEQTERVSKTRTSSDLAAAYEGSYYTIAGAGGDLMEWVNGYEQLLTEQGIGKPTRWISATGAQVNLFALSKGGVVHEKDLFKEDLTFLLFPLDGLHPGMLPLFKLGMQDRWFDDVIDNMGTWS